MANCCCQVVEEPVTPSVNAVLKFDFSGLKEWFCCMADWLAGLALAGSVIATALTDDKTIPAIIAGVAALLFVIKQILCPC
jgi:hypothetical protein